MNVAVPGRRPLTVCSGLLSRLDRLRGSWLMLFVGGGHWALLWGDVGTAVDPCKREGGGGGLHRKTKRERQQMRHYSKSFQLCCNSLIYPLICMSGAGWLWKSDWRSLRGDAGSDWLTALTTAVDAALVKAREAAWERNMRNCEKKS